MKQPIVKSLPCLVPGLDFETYINMEGFLHSSDIKLIKESISHYDSKYLKKSSNAQKEGTLGHTIIHEFESFNDRYSVMPHVDGRTKPGKELKAKAKEQADSEGKELIDQESFTRALRWRENIMAHPLTRKIYSNGSSGQNELSGFWRHLDGVDACLRMDKHLPDQGLVIDTKFMLTGSPRSFYRDVWKYGYHIQASWYLDGIKEITGEDHEFLFVVCEKSWPWNVQCFRMDEDFLERGRQEISGAINKYLMWCDCRNDEERSSISGYYDGIFTLKLKGQND